MVIVQRIIELIMVDGARVRFVSASGTFQFVLWLRHIVMPNGGSDRADRMVSAVTEDTSVINGGDCHAKRSLDSGSLWILH